MSDAVWRPITTAPRDGTWFLACATEKGWGATRVVRFSEPDDRLPIHGEGKMWPSPPTHWMPLANPPVNAALTAQATKAPAVSEADVGAAEIAGLVTAAAKVIADWSADCKVDDDSIVALLTAYNAMKPCGALLLNEVESAIQSAAQGGGTEGGEA